MRGEQHDRLVIFLIEIILTNKLVNKNGMKTEYSVYNYTVTGQTSSCDFPRPLPRHDIRKIEVRTNIYGMNEK